MICTFIGNREIYEDVREKLQSAIIDMIENKGVDTFYVGNHGAFDRKATAVLKALKNHYSFNFYTVLSYLPKTENEKEAYTFENSIYPEGMEKVPKKFAIIKRNEWMIEHSDFVLCFVKTTFGKAMDFKEKAIKKGKTVIELA